MDISSIFEINDNVVLHLVFFQAPFLPHLESHLLEKMWHFQKWVTNVDLTSRKYNNDNYLNALLLLLLLVSEVSLKQRSFASVSGVAAHLQWKPSSPSSSYPSIFSWEMHLFISFVSITIKMSTCAKELVLATLDLLSPISERPSIESPMLEMIMIKMKMKRW